MPEALRNERIYFRLGLDKAYGERDWFLIVS